MDPHVNIGQQSAGNELVTPPWLKLEGTKQSQWFILGYYEQLRDGNTPRGSLNAMFPHNPAVSGILWHIYPCPLNQLDRQDGGNAYLERRTEFASKRLVFQGGNKPPPPTNQNIAINIQKQPLPTPKNKTAVKHVYAALSITGVWLHAINKPIVDGTLLIVGIGPGCAAHQYFRSSGVKGCVRQSECDILVVNANGQPGPGILVAEATDDCEKIRILHDTLGG
jgi:hypothetical protein